MSDAAFNAYESLTISTSAVSLTAATYGAATTALVFVENAAVRFRLDGTDPTASVGMVAEPGSYIHLNSQDQIRKVKFIRRDSSDSTLRILYASGYGLPEVTTNYPVASNLVLGQVKITDGTSVADVFDLSTHNGLAVAIIDASGNQITSFGGGTQYTEADTDASITGTAVMWEDTSDTLRAVSAAKPLPVNVVAGGAGDGAILDGVDSGIKATVFDYANSNPLAVVLRDTSGDYVSVGGGTQYTEDAAAAGNPVGTALNLVREDARAGSLTNTDGDNVAARGTNYGELYVKHVDTIAVTQSGTWDEVGINDSGNSITVDNPQLSVVGGGTEATALRVTIANDSTGVLSVDDNGGNLSIDDGGNVITVDGSGSAGTAAAGVVTVQGIASMTPVQVSQATANNLNMTEASASAIKTAVELIDDGVYTDDTSTHTTGTSKGYGIMGVATPTDAAVNANDFGHVAMTTDRKLHVAVMDALPAGTAAIGKLAANSGVDIGDVDVTSIIPGTGATNLGKAEDGGHTTGDVGVMALGVRVDTPNATVAANTDYQYVAQDLVGGVRTALYETDFAVLGTNHVKKYYTNAGAVTDGIVWSPAAGKRWYVTDITLNVSAAATVTLEDDKVGGDEVVAKFELAANSGWTHSYATPLFSGEDAADLMVTTSAGNIYITVTGYEI